MITGKFNVIIGGQAGSESKGKLATYLSHKYKPQVIAMAASPNAGHTAFFEGVKYITYHLPVSWVGNKAAIVCLGPSSVIYLPTLEKEISLLGIDAAHLKIHPRAVMIRSSYMRMEKEEGLLKIGSTNQGVGIARREKLMRTEDITFAGMVKEMEPYIDDTVLYVNSCLNHGLTVMCEMTQGFDLCLEHGIDPHYCTSKIINPAMAMAEAGVSPRFIGDIYGVIRPYPIRVNNREGSSGPYAESPEIRWEDVANRCGHPDPSKLGEITTTTKLPRRVFEFSTQRFLQFVRVCHPTVMCLQFANYVDHKVFEKTQYSDLTAKVKEFVAMIEGLSRCSVAYIGTGPSHWHMIDRELPGRWGQGIAPAHGGTPHAG